LNVGNRVPNVLCFFVSVVSKYMNLSAFSKVSYCICIKVLSGVPVSGRGLNEHILLHSSPLDLSAPLVCGGEDRHILRNFGKMSHIDTFDFRRRLHRINSLTPELNPSAQRCLTRFFTGDFASLNRAFR
jgi:hypothetical protein